MELMNIFADFDYDTSHDFSSVETEEVLTGEAYLSSSEVAEKQYWEKLSYLLRSGNGDILKRRIVAHYPRRREVLLELPYGGKKVKKRFRLDETVHAKDLRKVLDVGNTYEYPSD